MPSTICTPISGRLRFDASELFLSVFGLPVSASFGSFSHTMVPHSAPPQSAMRMRELPPWVSHLPIGSAASAVPVPVSMSRAAAKRCRFMYCSVQGTSTAAVLAHYLGRREGGGAPVRATLPAADRPDRGY